MPTEETPPAPFPPDGVRIPATPAPLSEENEPDQLEMGEIPRCPGMKYMITSRGNWPSQYIMELAGLWYWVWFDREIKYKVDRTEPIGLEVQLSSISYIHIAR